MALAPSDFHQQQTLALRGDYEAGFFLPAKISRSLFVQHISASLATTNVAFTEFMANYRPGLAFTDLKVKPGDQIMMLVLLNEKPEFRFEALRVCSITINKLGGYANCERLGTTFTASIQVPEEELPMGRATLSAMLTLINSEEPFYGLPTGHPTRVMLASALPQYVMAFDEVFPDEAP